MKNKITKIMAILVLGVFLTSMMPVANAKSLKEWDETAINEYNNARSEYLKLKGFYESARGDWITARNKYRQNKNSENSENALENGRDFLLKADRTLVKYLEMIRVYVENEQNLDNTEKQNILSELDGYIEWLEEKQPEIENAETKKELVDLAKAVKTKWSEIKPATKKIIGQVMNAKVLKLINKAESASEKIENVIENLNEQGEDTAELEAWLDDFNTKIDLAKQKHEAAKEKYRQIENVRDADKLFREGNAFVKEANQYLRNAYKDLKDIVKELRKYKTITVSGTGKLEAEGDGSIYVSGDATVDLSGEEGTLIVTDNSGDITITVSGFGDKVEIEENKWQYTGTGSANIVGSDIIVEIEGKEIDLTAEGTGSATLTGTGSYKTCGKRCLEGIWTEEGISVSVAVEVE